MTALALKVKDVELTPENWTRELKPGEMAPDEIQDLLGDTNRLRKWIDKVEAYLKEAIQGTHESEEWEHTSSRYIFTRAMMTRVSLDTDKVKEEMGEEWYKEHCKTTDYYQIRIKEIDTPKGA